MANFYLDGNRNGIRLTDIQAGIDASFNRGYALSKEQGDIAAGILSRRIAEARRIIGEFIARYNTEWLIELLGHWTPVAARARPMTA